MEVFKQKKHQEKRGTIVNLSDKVIELYTGYDLASGSEFGDVYGQVQRNWQDVIYGRV